MTETEQAEQLGENSKHYEELTTKFLGDLYALGHSRGHGRADVGYGVLRAVLFWIYAGWMSSNMDATKEKAAAMLDVTHGLLRSISNSILDKHDKMVSQVEQDIASLGQRIEWEEDPDHG